MKHLENVPREINNWKVYGLATVACMAAVMIGYDVSSTVSVDPTHIVTDPSNFSVRLHRYLNFTQVLQG